MKNDNNLESINDELSKKVENIMGPTPENSNTVPKQASERFSPKEKPNEPKSAPKVSNGKKVNEPEPVSNSKKSEINPIKTSEPKEDELDLAVDDIAEKESDEILDAQDKEVEKAFAMNEKKPNFLKRFWQNKIARRTFLTLLIGGLLFIGIYPTTRYYILNSAGVRSSASIRVLDESTQQPLKNVSVAIGESSGQTNDQGIASLSGVKLGDQKLTINRKAFAEKQTDITIGWGSNPLGDTSITPTGLQYAFKIQDYLSGKPIEKAEAYSGDSSAFSDKEGKILLTLDTTGDEPISIKIKASGYREETIKDDGSGTEKTKSVNLVASQKQLFISKRSGKYDVYKIDADGKNEELVLSGTGSENSDITLSINPQGTFAALVSTRDNTRTEEGSLKSTLTLIDTDSNNTKAVDSSERIQINGWIADRLVYVKVNETKKKNGVSTHDLISYDYVNDSKTVIAEKMFFNDVEIAGDRIFYAPSVEYLSGTEDTTSPKIDKTNLGLFSVDSVGGNKQVLLTKEIWSITRQDFETIVVSSNNDWYEYKLNGGQANKLSGAPADQNGRIYANNGSANKSLWVDNRDGKGVLLMYDPAKAEDKILVSQSGLSNPIRWLNDTTAVFRVDTDQETADYVISTKGGEAKKIVDVTNTRGAESWYFY